MEAGDNVDGVSSLRHVAGPLAHPATGFYDFSTAGPRGAHLAREQRRLAAIVSADVVGYSRLMGRDESGRTVTVA
jgi:class 3 adenylate cyclase